VLGIAGIGLLWQVVNPLVEVVDKRDKDLLRDALKNRVFFYVKYIVYPIVIQKFRAYLTIIPLCAFAPLF
jgi:hypothetical protein